MTSSNDSMYQMPLLAPIAGEIVSVQHIEGEHLDAQQALFRIVNLAQAWIEADISEFDFAKLAEDLGATMTLGGMAIAIGALVDDAIIDVENIIRRLRENMALPESSRRPALEVVFRASVEVRASIACATLIIVLVFVPLFFLSGVAGRLLQPLGFAFIVALDASLIGAGSMGRSFLPEFSEGALVVGSVSVPGTSLEESDRLAHVVEKTLMQHPEITAIGRRTGRGEADAHGMNTEGSEIDLTLDMEAPVRLGLPRRTMLLT